MGCDTVIKSEYLTVIELTEQGTCHSGIDTYTTSARNPNQYKQIDASYLEC